MITRAGFEEEAIAAANAGQPRTPLPHHGAGRGRRHRRRPGWTRRSAWAGTPAPPKSSCCAATANSRTKTNPWSPALLLPDAPIVAWWPHGVPEERRRHPAGPDRAPPHHRFRRRARPARRTVHAGRAYRAGDTDLAWTRLTLWRVQLAAVLDQLDSGRGHGRRRSPAPSDSPSTVLLAAWLRLCLKIPVTLASSPEGTGVRRCASPAMPGTSSSTRPAGRRGRAVPAGPEGPADFPAAALRGRLPRRGNAPPGPGRGLRRGRARGPEANRSKEHPCQ